MAHFRRAPQLFLVLLMIWFTAGCSEPVSDNGALPFEPEPGTPPEVEILVGPEDRTNEADALFEFQCLGDVNCAFECSLNDGPGEPCDSPLSFENLEDGDYVFEVIAIDDLDQASEPAQWAWTIDTVAPAIVDLTGPPAFTDEANATLSFGCSKEECTFECGVGGARLQSCESPMNYGNLEDGVYIFYVRPTDDLGNRGETASHTWTVDRASALVVDLEGPAELTNETTATFTFGCSKDNCTFSCQLNDESSEACNPGVTFDDLDDGEHLFVVIATDEFGASGPAAQWTWTVDTLAPTIVDLDGPEELTTEAAATFTFDCSKDDCTFECELSGTNNGVIEDASDCTSGKSYSELSDDEYTFSITATDLAGNTSATETFTWTVDTVVPSVVDLTGPADLTNETSATFTFDCSKEDCVFECALSDTSGTVEAATVCSSGKTYSDLADGTYTFSVTATDLVGNVSTPVTYTWTVDTVAPVVTNLVGPTDPTNETSATFAFGCSLDDCAFECSLVSANNGTIEAATDCDPGKTYSGLSDDDYTFSITATDEAGNIGQAATYTWTVDTVAPTTVDLTGPEDPTNDTFATFAFNCSKDDCAFSCELSGTSGSIEAATDCSSGKTYSGLADDDYTFSVTATDLAGNVSSTETFNWTVDTVAPAVTNLTGPADYTNNTSATFDFGCSLNDCAFECSLVSANQGTIEAATDCASGKTYSGLADDDYTFTVTASDSAGNVSATETFTWKVDTVAPTITNVTGPADITNETSATFGFDCSKNDCAFECELAGTSGSIEAATDCGPGKTYSGLSDDDYTFTVTATDLAGNVSSAETRTWTVDTVAPTIVDLVGPAELTNETSASVAFNCSKEDCQFSCSLEGSAQGLVSGPMSCSNEAEFSGLPDDDYTFSVTATDQVGNTSSTETFTWTIDTVAPVVVDLVGPADPTNETEATFGFECSKEDCTFSCSLADTNGAIEAATACSSGKTYFALTSDDYTFTVTATDLAGNVSSTETFTWTVDTVAPAVVDLIGPANPTNDTSATFDFDCSKNDCSFECALSGTNSGTIEVASDCDSGKLYSGLSDDDYTFTVTATDLAGNVSSTETFTWTVDTVAPLINIFDAPNLETTEDWAVFEFECSNKPSCLFECALDYEDGSGVVEEGDWQSCTSPHLLDDLEEGDYTLRLRATDTAGNQATVSLEWTVVPVSPAISVSAGEEHTCKVRLDGSLWCWGRGSLGRLGLGDTDNRIAPEQVGDDFDWATLSAGARHTCAIRNDGSLWCWGNGDNSQLGLGDSADRSTPHQVGVDLDWATVSAGQDHTCATRDDGSLWCWGSNGRGQLGLGDLDDRSTPHQVGDETTWAQVSAGTEHTCATRSDHSLWCWGRGFRGRLGLGDSNDRDIPHQVGDETVWAKVSAGAEHTCAIGTDGSLWCWGWNNIGRLGLGTFSFFSRTTPQQVGVDLDWVTVSAGSEHSCATRNDGSLWCWGSGRDGRLGLGDVFDRNAPDQVGVDLDWTSVSTGEEHTCAARDDNSLECWGYNRDGQLGINIDGGNKLAPTLLDLNPTFAVVSAASSHGCGISEQGSLWCWGWNDSGQLGLGDTARRTSPHQVGDSLDWHTVSAGTFHTCATRNDNSLWCWGAGLNGRLGLDDTTNRITPHQVGVDTNWATVSAGDRHTCAKRNDGSLWCWGFGSNGRLGLGDTSSYTTPQQVGVETSWATVSAGGDHTCATRNDDSLWCWGSGTSRQLGLGDTSNRITPHQVGVDLDWDTVSSGSNHTCARRNDGSLWCWGFGGSGRLGLGNTTSQDTPHQVGVDLGWANVSAGTQHTCATRDDGSLWCWGLGTSGRLGLGDTSNRTSPHQVGNHLNWDSVSAGNTFTVGLRTDGTAWSWGINEAGQLGDGTAWKDEPTPVVLDL